MLASSLKKQEFYVETQNILVKAQNGQNPLPVSYNRFLKSHFSIPCIPSSNHVAGIS
uniref:Uncharacterized protein n=1 Tax=Anguilla anguilla TaxID=7936 RepID=A0A0E9T656_ANGAN